MLGSYMPLDRVNRYDRLQHDTNHHQMMLQKLPTLSVKELGCVPDPAVHNPHALVATLVRASSTTNSQNSGTPGGGFRGC